MKRFVFLCLLAVGYNLVNAQSCVEITNPEDRLACFDVLSVCTGIYSAIARLECFEKAYFKSHSSEAVTQEASATYKSKEPVEAPSRSRRVVLAHRAATVGSSAVDLQVLQEIGSAITTCW